MYQIKSLLTGLDSAKFQFNHQFDKKLHNLLSLSVFRNAGKHCFQLYNSEMLTFVQLLHLIDSQLSFLQYSPYADCMTSEYPPSIVYDFAFSPAKYACTLNATQWQIVHCDMFGQHVRARRLILKQRTNFLLLLFFFNFCWNFYSMN